MPTTEMRGDRFVGYAACMGQSSTVSQPFRSTDEIESRSNMIILKTVSYTFSLVLLLTSLSLPLQAEDEPDFHPLLTDRFEIGIGAFLPDKTFKLRVEGSRTLAERDFDFNEAAKLDNDETTGALNFRWNFGKKWNFQAQYWGVKDSNTASLTEDVEWEDVVFKEGTFVEAGIESQVARLFFGRTFSTGPQHEFGAGLGIHWLEVEAYIQGQALTSEGDSDFYRGNVDAGVPLPNIGAWYRYSWSPRWMLSARVDWLSASIGDYSGGLWNAQAGISFALSRHFGVGAFYNFFSLDLDVDKSDWHGKAESTQNGPFLALIATW